MVKTKNETSQTEIINLNEKRNAGKQFVLKEKEIRGRNKCLLQTSKKESHRSQNKRIGREKARKRRTSQVKRSQKA